MTSPGLVCFGLTLREFHRNVRVPTWTGKPGKMGKHFPVREKSGNFDETGKVRENHIIILEN